MHASFRIQKLVIFKAKTTSGDVQGRDFDFALDDLISVLLHNLEGHGDIPFETLVSTTFRFLVFIFVAKFFLERLQNLCWSRQIRFQICRCLFFLTHGIDSIV